MHSGPDVAMPAKHHTAATRQLLTKVAKHSRTRSSNILAIVDDEDNNCDPDSGRAALGSKRLLGNDSRHAEKNKKLLASLEKN